MALQTADALHFYMISGRVNHAIKLAMANDMDTEVMNMGLSSSKQMMIEAARYFEAKEVCGCHAQVDWTSARLLMSDVRATQMFDKAVSLYHRGGRTSNAVDLAFATEQFDALRDIAATLGANTGSARWQPCALRLR